jgi:hypothetical protein
MKFAIKKTFFISLMVAFGLALFISSAESQERAMPYGTFKVAAAEEKGYGAKKPVSTLKEAKAALEDFYKDKDVTVGKIEEKDLFFEAEILDKKGKVVDKVIIDKRTGRIRSIY